LRDFPILLVTSRKGFIGKIANARNPEERDSGFIASCIAALCLGIDNTTGGCDILCLHNVKGMKQGAAMIMDAVKQAK
jgi:dihydropteroate synthase